MKLTPNKKKKRMQHYKTVKKFKKTIKPFKKVAFCHKT